jgi:hypothetical protein
MNAIIQITKELVPPQPCVVHFQAPSDLTLLLGMVEEAKIAILEQFKTNEKRIVVPPPMNGEALRTKRED